MTDAEMAAALTRFFRRLRPIELIWPNGDFVMTRAPYEFAREFYLSFLFVEVRWFALDNLREPPLKLRMANVRWGLV